MRILYIAKHDSGGNEDEAAILHALQEQLGHNVIRYREELAKRLVSNDDHAYDFLLIHKWGDHQSLARIPSHIYRVFWYFDLVDLPNDPKTAHRSWNRIEWMKHVTPLIDMGLCTDGDWVDKDTSGKLQVLRQGADVRYTGPGTAPRCEWDVLFTGTRNGGELRETFCDEMKAAYGNRFRHVPNSLHQRELAEEISKCRIVVAPDSPVTDRYWSNRVYLMLGFGAFLLHPYCTDLAKEYVEGKELVFYRDRSDLHDKVAYFLAHPEERLAIAQAGYERTLRDHTYTKRCERLIELVQAGIKAKAGVS